MAQRQYRCGIRGDGHSLNWTQFRCRRALVIPLPEITMDTAQRSHVTEVDWLVASPIGP